VAKAKSLCGFGIEGYALAIDGLAAPPARDAGLMPAGERNRARAATRARTHPGRHPRSIMT
jgi:hypothetical protein